MIHQLRIYEIFEGNKHAFHDRFESHAIRIMESHGFEFVALWETTTGDGIERRVHGDQSGRRPTAGRAEVD